jgi:hypothetical protein
MHYDVHVRAHTLQPLQFVLLVGSELEALQPRQLRQSQGKCCPPGKRGQLATYTDTTHDTRHTTHDTQWRSQRTDEALVVAEIDDLERDHPCNPAREHLDLILGQAQLLELSELRHLLGQVPDLTCCVGK